MHSSRIFGGVSDTTTRLNAALQGRYAIERELGEGGMATVYLADDLKHERKVALKVLKPELAAVVGAERFLAEIKTTANLTHPHILPLFDSGEADGFLFYVMPHIEGESLRERIDREKQLPVDEAVKIATDLAEALDYAHRHKIIHRDIKPANILIHEGRPLIADFGIALAVGVAGGGRLTETGLSLGTPHYMSPEQATGDQNVGPQTDTYALGCVLYEMLVGEPPYTGPTAQAVLGQIIAGETASATKKRASVPANVDAALRCSLEKLPADRFTSAQEFVRALGDEHFRYGELATAGAGAAVGPWNQLSILMTATTLLFALAFGWALLRPEAPAPLTRLSLAFEAGQGPGGSLEFTADGSGMVYTGLGTAGGRQLWIRRWADLDATPIRGTEGALTFALSPDGREVAFSAFPGPLRVVALEGGRSRTLVEQVYVTSDWTPDGYVYFNTVGPSVLARVPAMAGVSDTVEVLTELLERETIHSHARVLPGGKMAVFQVSYAQNGEDAEIWAIDLDTREREFLTAGSTPRYASTGHLLFATPDGALMAASIDPGSAELSNTAVSIAEGLLLDLQFGVVFYGVSEDGTLAYSAGNDLVGSVEPVWVTRSGVATPVDPGWRFDPPGAGARWSLSPDGSRVALTRLLDGNVDIWIKQLPDGPFERLTFDDQDDRYPVWTPDGQFVRYVRNESGGNYDVWQRRADGTGTPELLLDDELSLYDGRGSSDGEWMVFRTTVPQARRGERDIVAFRPGVDSVVIPLIANAEFVEQSPALSPDGRWLAYTSDETGRQEVYVTPFPNVESAKVQVSAEGGSAPLWANSHSELFFVDGDRRLVVAQVDTDSAFRVLQRETLFVLGPEYGILSTSAYDVAPDDQRFFLARSTIAAAGEASTGGGRFILVYNWFEEFRDRAGN